VSLPADAGLDLNGILGLGCAHYPIVVGSLYTVGSRLNFTRFSVNCQNGRVYRLKMEIFIAKRIFNGDWKHKSIDNTCQLLPLAVNGYLLSCDICLPALLCNS